MTVAHAKASTSRDAEDGQPEVSPESGESVDVQSVATKVQALGAEVDRVRERLLEFQVDRVVASAVERLGKRFWVLAVVATVAGVLGVPLSARAFLEADTRKLIEATSAAQEAARRLDEQSKSVEAEASKARETIATVRQAADELGARLAEVDATISELRGDLGRASSEGDLRLVSLQEQVRVLTDAIDKAAVKTQIQNLTKKEQNQREAFDARGAIAVRIVYHPRSEKKAQGYQALLASKGYVTQLVASDFAELKSKLEAKTGEVQVVTNPDERQLGQEVGNALGLKGAERWAPTVKQRTVQVLVF